MAAIILPRKHYTQPQGRAVIDWAHPLADALAFAETPTATTGLFESVGAVAQTSMRGGVAYGFNGSSYLKTPATTLKNFPLTFLAIFDRRVAATGSLVSIGQGSQRHLLYFLGDGRLRMFSSSGLETGDTARAQAGVPALNTTYWAAGRVSAVNARDVWLNGEFWDENTINVNTGESNTNAIGTYWNNDSPALTLDGKMQLACAWARALSDDELREMYANPYQIFRADPVRIYSLPPVITIPSLSNPGVIDITTTSARPRVTLAY